MNSAVTFFLNIKLIYKNVSVRSGVPVGDASWLDVSNDIAERGSVGASFQRYEDPQLVATLLVLDESNEPVLFGTARGTAR